MREVHVITLGMQGPPGAQGPAGPSGASAIQYVADGAIGGHRAVIPNGFGGVLYADQSNPLHKGKVIGVTLNAANNGEPIDVVIGGEVVEPTWNWLVGAVYLGVNGLLTQSVPATGFLQVIGVATAPTKLVVSIGLPIDLGA